MSWFVVRSALAGGSGLMLTMLFLDGPGQLAGVLLGGIPLVVLRARGRQRRAALIRLMPATLDLIIRSLRAGHALSDALCTAAEEAPEPLGVELLQLTEQHRLGRPLRDCFDHLVERNPEVFDLRLMGSAVMLQRETGANLIEMLEHLAETIRERLLFTHKLAAVTAEVRVSATILASLPFLVTGALLLLQPRYLLPLITTGLGQSLLTGAGLSLLLGLGLMRSLAQVRV